MQETNEVPARNPNDPVPPVTSAQSSSPQTLAPQTKRLPKIVVVGGGAGGLELVTKLGNTLGKKKKAEIILVDKNTSHLWKPLLHEVAVGVLDDSVDAVSFRAHAQKHHFVFRVGNVTNIDRDNKQLILAPLNDEDGTQVLPETRIDYDYLVMALGSVCNDFGTQGVKENCIFLDSPDQARRFRNKLLNTLLRLQRLPDQYRDIRVAIVGGGATGVELSAELHHAVQEVRNYGFTQVNPTKLSTTLVEAGPRILGALPERISQAAHRELEALGVHIKVNTSIVSASQGELTTKDGEVIPADLIVWSAGVKVPDFMREIGGLETNRLNQLVVNAYLQTSKDDCIFAIGDCAEFTSPDGKRVPPRAQSAHQMAKTCYRNLKALLNDKPLKAFVYKDHGSLVSLAEYSTVGTLMGNLGRGSMFIEGRLARFAYISLYKQHQIAIHGFWQTMLLILSSGLNRWLRPRLKMH